MGEPQLAPTSMLQYTSRDLFAGIAAIGVALAIRNSAVRLDHNGRWLRRPMVARSTGRTEELTDEHYSRVEQR